MQKRFLVGGPLLVTVACVGIQVAGAVEHLDRLHVHEYEMSAGSGTLLAAAVLTVGVASSLCVRRVFRRMADISEVQKLRLAGLAAVYASLLLVGAAWSPAFAASILAQLLAAAAIGICAGATSVVLSERVGWRLATGGVIVGLTAGFVFGVVGPVVMNSLAEYRHVHAWMFERPHTIPGMRATLLFPAVFGFVGSARLNQARRTLVDLQEGPLSPLGDANDTLRTRRHRGAPLEISGLNLSYGQLQVLFGVDLHVEEGETVALLGTNGAGKSSVLRAAFGLHQPSHGRVWSGETDITGWPAERLARHGMLQVPGGKGVFPSLSVRDNLRMAAYPLPGSKRVQEGIDRAVSAFPRLGERLDQPAGVLSGGEQQMVALARAWVIRPKLLAIDELTLGLAPIIIGELLDFVRLLRAEGVPILIVEQSVYVAFELCERAYFLERGHVRFEGLTSDLMSRADLLRSIFFEASDEASQTTTWGPQ